MDGNGKPPLAPDLPRAIEDLESDGPRDANELWRLARTYSRLRHCTSPRKYPLERGRFSDLKVHCIRLALARDRAGFLVFVDPGSPQLWLIYHRAERTLLHLPVETELSPSGGRGQDQCSPHSSELELGGRGFTSPSGARFRRMQTTIVGTTRLGSLEVESVDRRRFSFPATADLPGHRHVDGRAGSGL